MGSIAKTLLRHSYLLVIAAVVAIAVLYKLHPAAIQQPGDSGFRDHPGEQHLSGTSDDPAARRVGILFTGNSITFVNNLPYMLLRIAEADKGSHLRLEIASDTHPNISIGEVWRDGRALPLLQSRRWDYVVLQEHSWWVGRPDQMTEMERTVPLLAGAVRAAGAQPLLFMTWVKQPGSHWYTKEDPEFENPDYMQQSIDYYTAETGRLANTPVVPVGDYWWKFIHAHPEIDLYRPDGTHPSVAGTYLSALLFYRMVARRDVRDIDFVPPGLNPSDAAIIRTAAAQ